jgi:hypothetical protein
MESLLQTPVPPVSKLKKISKYAPLTAHVQKRRILLALRRSSRT